MKEEMPPPSDPIVAVSHPDPYPYYAGLVRQPVHRDERLGLWVAASAEDVTAVLRSVLCRVRPPGEPVPAALVGTPAGDIFRHLVRMNDGEHHYPLKQALSATLSTISTAQAELQAARWAQRLDLKQHPAALSPHVVGTLLGVPEERLPDVAVWTRDFVRCIAPGADTDALARGQSAARHLLELFHGLPGADNDTVLARLAHSAARADRSDADLVVANAIGLLSQAYDATAGLIGNTLVALARDAGLRSAVTSDPKLLRAVVAEVLCHDAPVQNTRRFVAADGIVAGQPMRARDAILVVLAAANRDPAANANPSRFDPARADRRTFTFGIGAHACPGETLAQTIAQAGVAQLIADGAVSESLLEDLTYQPSVNARIPVFG
jgi:cytochrome P450